VGQFENWPGDSLIAIRAPDPMFGDMAKATYRIVPHKKGPACDVEMTEAGAKPRIISASNTEAEAWDWLHEKMRIDNWLRAESKVSRASTEGNQTPQSRPIMGQCEIRQGSGPIASASRRAIFAP
jgi:hypothetical protein